MSELLQSIALTGVGDSDGGLVGSQSYCLMSSHPRPCHPSGSL
jgi:hypothetical protein